MPTPQPSNFTSNILRNVGRLGLKSLPSLGPLGPTSNLFSDFMKTVGVTILESTLHWRSLCIHLSLLYLDYLLLPLACVDVVHDTFCLNPS